ncbi:MAG TPA: GPP34 family phosphoprotein [Bacteroidales bacterium]|nr:GPP34 family phosphoprotein [Bacteroidales bacterium]
MQLNLIEKYLLIALDAKKGKFVIDSLSLHYGIAGAILLELSEMNKIEIENKRLVLVDDKFTKNEVINASIKVINKAKRKRTAKYWVNKIGNSASRYKRQILKELSGKNVLSIHKKSYFFGLFNFYSYPLLDRKYKDDIVDHLLGIVFDNKKADLEGLLLLSLLNSSKLIRTLFANKKDYKAANKRIKELTKNIEISDAVQKTLKEIQTAVLVATTSAFLGATSSST